MKGSSGFNGWKVAKWLLLPAFLFILYFQLRKLPLSPDLLDRVQLFYKGEYFVFIFCILITLTFVNYAIESIKWQLLISPFQAESFLLAYRDVMMGILFSIMTPARLGEMVGRVLYFKNKVKLTGTVSSLVGSMSQNMVIIFLGCIGGFLYYYQDKKWDVWFLVGLFGILGGMTLFWLLIYFNINKVFSLLSKIPLPGRWTKYLYKIKDLENYTFAQLNVVLLLSLLRVLLWTIQYIFILWILMPEINWLHGIPIVWLIFLIQTGIPLPLITGLVARSSVAIFMWKNIGVDEWNAFASSFVIYFYNLLIPSAVGLCVVLLNINKGNGKI